HVGFPFYGIGAMKWDEILLTQGIISISKLTVIYPSGQLIDVPGNGSINPFDLNKTGKTRTSMYLHLLTSISEEENYLETGLEQEKVVLAVNQLELSDDTDATSIRASMKLGEFEKDLENRWKMRLDYIPPLLSTIANPFLQNFFIEMKTKLEQFQNSLELASTTGEEFEGHTLETKHCLLELAKVRCLLTNIENGVATHPYYLYEGLNQFLNTISLLHRNASNYKMVPYQHDKLAQLFPVMLEVMSQGTSASQETSRLEFHKKDRCYVSERLPEELHDAKEVYLILQKVDTAGSPHIEGLKLSGYSRLLNTMIFGVQGISLVRLERAPFNHSFSKRANIYSVEKGVEWDHALKEGRLAFDYKDNAQGVQAYLYWR
ncbi:MAG: type VI secretion system baseplate subunit TssK, partial [Chlamydiia bacterium]|nr:type VI secretion system baseplate subunit TssK [Chlamydiia bacterium]